MTSIRLGPPPAGGYTLPFPEDIWLQIALYFVMDPSLSASMSAKSRGVMACLSKGSYVMVYGTPSFWSSIVIFDSVSLDRLRFVMSRCERGLIDITICILGVRRTPGLPTVFINNLSLVAAVMSAISPSASRWRSFRLITESPSVFQRVNLLSQTLGVSSLARLEVGYVHMPGYSPAVNDPDLITLPFQPSNWFMGPLASIRRLTSFGASCVVGMLNRLEELYITDYTRPYTLESSVVPDIIASARQLRVLRLGWMRPFQIPVHSTMRSTSIRVLDLEFGEERFMSRFLHALVLPGLVDFTVRDVGDSVHCLLTARHLLAGVATFGIHHSIGDEQSLRLLFAALPSLIALDLTHTGSTVFDAYYSWAFSCIRFHQPNYAVNLRQLLLGEIAPDAVLALVSMIAENVPVGIDRVGLERLVLERSSALGVSNSMLMLHHLVTDFVLVDTRHRGYIITTSTAIYGTGLLSLAITASLCERVSVICVVVRVSRLAISFMSSSSVDVASSVILVPNAPSHHPVPPATTQLFVEVWEQVVRYIAERSDPEPLIRQFLFDRSALRLTCRLFKFIVKTCPSFWTRLLISPRVPLSHVAYSLAQSEMEPLVISFAAHQLDDRQCLTFDDEPCDTSTYFRDAAYSVSLVMDRCVSLKLDVECPPILQLLSEEFGWAEPRILEKLEVSYGCREAFLMRPFALEDFHFDCRPPFGKLFPPVQCLTWTTGTVPFPIIAYTTSGIPSCVVTHPNDYEATWAQALQVFSSEDLEILVIDGIQFSPACFGVISPDPLFSLRILVLTLRGRESIAYLMIRFYMPNLHVLRVFFDHADDLRCLSMCSPILCSIKELVLIGACPLSGDASTLLFPQLVTLCRLDLRLTSRTFFEALMVASRRVPLASGMNTYACPSLRELAITGVSLDSIRMLILQREMSRLPPLESLVVDNAARAVDVEVEDWFRSQNIAISASFTSDSLFQISFSHCLSSSFSQSPSVFEVWTSVVCATGFLLRDWSENATIVSNGNNARVYFFTLVWESCFAVAQYGATSSEPVSSFGSPDNHVFLRILTREYTGFCFPPSSHQPKLSTPHTCPLTDSVDAFPVELQDMCSTFNIVLKASIQPTLVSATVRGLLSILPHVHSALLAATGVDTQLFALLEALLTLLRLSLRRLSYRCRHHLPNELWLIIFNQVCTAANTTFFSYNHARDVLFDSFPEWADILSRDHRFWSQIAIDCHTKPTSVEHQLLYTSGKPLDVVLLFDAYDNFDYGGAGPKLCTPIELPDYPARVDRARRCLQTALSSVPQWKSACLWSTTEEFMRPIVEVLRDADAPMLSSLLYGCPMVVDTLLFVQPPQLFGGRLPVIHDLHLVDAALPWAVSGYFSTLTSLYLESLASDAWPTVQEFVNALRSATVLRDLTVGGGGTSDGPLTVILTFTMPCLRSLTLFNWPHITLFLRVLAAGSFPRLTELRLHGFDQAAWTSLYRLPIFRQLENVCLVGGHVSVFDAPLLLTRLINVIKLDVSSAGRAHFDTMARVPHLCPKLTHIMINDSISLQEISEYIDARKSLQIASDLLIVDYYHSIPFPVAFSILHVVRHIANRLDKFHTYPTVL
ncbi:hypothetical protein C8R43DRAFT_940795 [Mycena crocata]|nr:hypothetical protein C8R43DRAFT_940795 [Mycena crocata]